MSEEIIQIPIDALSAEALDGLIEEFVTSEGTDYGTVEYTLDQKRAAVMRQLRSGDAVIIFNPDKSSANIVHKRDLLAPGLF